jgi:sulfite reductase beta subunit-like hemoprotein
MPAVDIPAAKRAGLPVDVTRLTRDGDDWLSPEERYALKTHGVCAQLQPEVFMIRVRTNGSVGTDAARGLASVAETYAKGWLHLTTRQQVELHHVRARDVTAVLDAITALGVSTQSACGHTVRGVMSCPDSGVSLDEPFDCTADAGALWDHLAARSPRLDIVLPSRLNIAFGGCRECREYAKVNDLGFVSVVADDRAGYEVWLGGSLGRSAPTLAVRALDFVPREDVLAVVDALVEVYVEHGDFDRPNRARLKFLVRELGCDVFLDLFRDAFAGARRRTYPAPEPLPAPLSSSVSEILAHAPEGGWGSGVRPQRIAGRALVTVRVPLGDIDADDLRLLADVADDFADERLYLTRNQNVALRHVRLPAVPAVRANLATVGLGLEGADQAGDVRACTGGPVCTLAITPAQRAGAQLVASAGLTRNSGLRVHVSGCPNACAHHQAADLGFSGGKVTIDGEQVLGYQVWLGGDLGVDTIGRVAGRIAASDVVAITEAVVGVWEALRERGETLAATVDRFGLDAFKAQIDAVFAGRWEPGPEPATPPGTVTTPVPLSDPDADTRLPLVGVPA